MRSRRFWALSLIVFGLVSLSPLVSDRVSAEDAAILVAPQELQAGGRSSLTITTFDSATREAIARPVAVTLRRGETLVATIYTGGTGEKGHLKIPFDVPRIDSGSYSLEVQVSGIGEPLKLDLVVSAAPAILIETDKPIYKPSQTILGRVLLVDNALRPTSGEVELTFHDAKGIRIDRRQLTANEYGVAEFSLDLASEVNFGVWKVRAASEGVESILDLRVEEYTLPHFDLSVNLERPWALVDEEVQGTVDARYFFGKDVQGTAALTAKRWVGTWEEYARVEGEIEDGQMAFTLPAVGFVAGSPQNSGQGAVTIDVEVVDSTGYAQTTSEVLTITESSLVIGLIPRARSMKPEIPFEVLVTARTPEGENLDAEVTVTATFYGMWGSTVGEQREVVSCSGGSGLVEIVPPAESYYADLVGSATRDGHATSTLTRVEGSYSSGSSFLSLSRIDGEGSAPIGSVLSFSTVSTHPGTVYYEVYAGGRTVLSDASESADFSFAVTPEMAPKAKVVAYKINPDNEVSADSLSFDVELATSIQIAAAFSSDPVRPGDPVEVTIDAGTGERTMLGVSIVDESVLALGRSRLHLAGLFAELEKRFLEPRVEVHEGEDPGPGGDMFLVPRAYGALDIIHDVGLEVVASEGVLIATGESLFRDWAEDAVGPPMAGGNEGPSGASALETVRVRQYFPETWVWEPVLLTDDSGVATLTLTAPDSITGWKLSAVGSSPAGIGFGESDLTVFQEFFVEPSLPYSVTRGEEFPVSVAVYNYLEDEQQVDLSFLESDWFELLGESQTVVTVPPNSATSVAFPIRPTSLGSRNVEILAIGSVLSDAVRREMLVVPEGLPAEIVSNGVIEPGSSVPLDVSFPPMIVPGSSRAFLHVTPSPVAQTMNGVSDLLGMPYGCGEQNMMFLAPDIEILKYLREIGELSPEIRATAEYYVNVGYQRQLTFGSDDGGFSAFGGEHGSIWLTAFVLSTFSRGMEVRDIDEAVLSGAAGMIISRQEEDGSFRTDDFLIHKEMDGGMSNVYAMAAFVTGALADYAAHGQPSAEVLSALSRAAEYLRNARSIVNDDPYSLSIAACALLNVAGFEAEGEAVIDRLLELAIEEGVGIHWEPYPVETTGYAAMALLAANGGVGRPEAGAAVDWLSAQRNALGGFGGTTQDTVVTIRALFAAARKVHRDLDVTLSVRAGDETIWSLHVDASNYDLLHSTALPLGADVDPGLVLESVGSGSVGYQVVKRFNVPGETLPPPRDMLIQVEYLTDGIEVDDILDVVVRLNYTGPKEETGMVIADIGVPTGFEVVRSTVDDLVESGTVSRVEIAGRKVIFYIDSLVSGEPLTFAFQMRALYPVRAEGPISRAYEYYDPDVDAYHQMSDILVTPSDGGEPGFIRGDSNADGAIDISDGVNTLGVLFLGSPQFRVRCEDAADTNDDGTLNITDPIYLLQHLFLGGPAPLPPYPDRGEDPTADDLICP